MKRSISQLVLAGVLVLACLAVAGCGSRINQANFEKVETGMTLEQVHAILGPPTESSSRNFGGLSGTSSTWTTKEATISIVFVNGKVRAKEFSKPGQ